MDKSTNLGSWRRLFCIDLDIGGLYRSLYRGLYRGMYRGLYRGLYMGFYMGFYSGLYLRCLLCSSLYMICLP